MKLWVMMHDHIDYPFIIPARVILIPARGEGSKNVLIGVST